MDAARKPLTGKVTLVTGGSGGIGAAVVRRLAHEGADVAFSYVGSSETASTLVNDIRRSGRRAIAIKADQAVFNEAESLVWDAHDRFGRLDIFVNAVSVCVTGLIGDPSVNIKALNRLFETNVRGVVTAVRTIVPLINDGGRIILVGPVDSIHLTPRGISDFLASKAAIASYARGWSRDLGPRAITVNTVQPGAIKTETSANIDKSVETTDMLTSLGRLGRPEDVASAVFFLVGPEASFITGATMTVDGGLSV